MVDRSVRSLLALQSSASTARVLNLLSIARKHGEEPEYQAKPFFQNPRLNQAILVKHRLRANELDLFPQYRQTATKVLVPVDRADLRYGGGYVFVGQRDYAEILSNVFGAQLTPGEADWRMLAAIDEIPSLDPFLLREQLRRHGLEPARCCFEISDADLTRMFAFVQKEVLELVNMSFGGGATGPSAHVAKLAKKLLSDSIDEDMEPLRQTLRLEPAEYLEGIFCWKGFLYYKWSLMDLLPQVGEVAQMIRTVVPRGPADNATRAYLTEARPRLHTLLKGALKSVKATLSVYDTAYAGLTKRADPMAFREFLLTAPPLFNELGERLGAVRHIVSFCHFRMSKTGSPIGYEELQDMFMDFEECLSFVQRDEERARERAVG
jgi:hypothetical protein